MNTLTYSAKKVMVWILGFATLLAALNAFNGVLMWTTNSSDYVFLPYYIAQFIGGIQVTTYFVVSIAFTFLFLGITIFTATDVLNNDTRLRAIEHVIEQNSDALVDGFAANTTTFANVKSRVEQNSKALTDGFATSLTTIAAIKNLVGQNSKALTAGFAANKATFANVKSCVEQNHNALINGFAANLTTVAAIKNRVGQNSNALADGFVACKSAIEATGSTLQEWQERQQQVNETVLEAQRSVQSYVSNAIYKSSESTTALIKDLLTHSIDALEDGMKTTVSSIEATEFTLQNWMANQKHVNETVLEAQASIKSAVSDAIYQQEKVNSTRFSDLETALRGLTGEIFEGVEKIDAQSRRDVTRRMSRLGRIAKKNTRNLANLKTQIEAVENAVAFPASTLTGENSPADVKGIGPYTLKQLEAMKITDVGKFLRANPLEIARNTRLSGEAAQRLQGKIQLLMLPNMSNTDTVLLELAGVLNTADMAEQEPLGLSIKLSEAANALIEKGIEPTQPTLETVISWIQIAKL